MSKKTIGIILACILGILIPVIVLTVGPSNSTELPAMTSKEQNYLSFFQSNAYTVYDAFMGYAALSDELGIGTDEWAIAATNQLNVVQIAYNEAIQMNPPASMAHIHLKYIQAINNFYYSAQLVISSIDNKTLLDADESIAKMELGLQYLEETVDLIVAFKATHSS